MANLETITDQHIELTDPSLYINRELSWLDFNERVLEEALDPTLPLLERVKFLAIFSNNLDEFFMIRVAGLRQQVAAGVTEAPADGMSPAEQLAAIREKVLVLQHQQRECWHDEILPALAEYDIHVAKPSELEEAHQKALETFFRREVYPVLTPLAVDPGRPFPHISNLSLNLAIEMRDASGGTHFARVKVPTGTFKRFISLHDVVQRYGEQPCDCLHTYLKLEDVIHAHLELLFPGMTIEQTYPFRVTRDADVEIAEDEASDLLETIEKGVRMRRFGHVVRLTITHDMPTEMRKTLMHNMHLGEDSVYAYNQPLGLTDLFQLASIDVPELKIANFVPRHPNVFDAEGGIFAAIRNQDILVHHPYDSFEPIVSFIREAAHDPGVLAIKMTLYRVGSDSPIVRALLEAREAGKQVAVLVELKARFDEENNIVWAKRLEANGVHVVYGLVGLKTHSKVAMVVRREQGGIHRYVHLGTGNYNASTARIYTDLGFLTCNETIAEDVTELFNRLTGYAPQATYEKLWVAPEHLRKNIRRLIEREIEHAQAGREAKLMFKMNSLTDAKTIRKLYEASQAGVRIELITRGICNLRPGIRGISENIHVRSIVGRFLEHSRIYWFANGGEPEVYAGSADLMERNLNRRVEVVFPVENPDLKAVLLNDILQVQLDDNVRARVLHPDGQWVRLRPGPEEAPLDSQQWAMDNSRRQSTF